MNRNTVVAWGMAFVFSLIGCASINDTSGSADNKSVVVRRMDAKGDESVRIYIDGKRAGRLANGGIWSGALPEGTHSIYANYDGDDDKNSELLYFTVNNTVCYFSVEVIFNERNRYSGIKITQEDTVENNNGMPGNNNAIDGAIAKSFAAISENIQEEAIVAIVNIVSEDEKIGEYAVEELTLLFVNAGKYDIVDRRSLDIIRDEQNYQITGEVDDNSILSIGHILGAGVVVTGSIDERGKRLRLKALDVKTARIVAMSSEETGPVQ
jgi:hypothetical protein